MQHRRVVFFPEGRGFPFARTTADFVFVNRQTRTEIVRR
jgi:hypothetical protein